MEPLVSIITPAFNASKYLVPFFESVLDQEYSNYELIFINDGSTDDTEKIAPQFSVAVHLSDAIGTAATDQSVAK